MIKKIPVVVEVNALGTLVELPDGSIKFVVDGFKFDNKTCEITFEEKK